MLDPKSRDYSSISRSFSLPPSPLFVLLVELALEKMHALTWWMMRDFSKVFMPQPNNRHLSTTKIEANVWDSAYDRAEHAPKEGGGEHLLSFAIQRVELLLYHLLGNFQGEEMGAI